MKTAFTLRTVRLTLLMVLTGLILAADSPQSAPQKGAAPREKSDKPAIKEAPTKVKYVQTDDIRMHEEVLYVWKNFWLAARQKNQNAAYIVALYENDLKEYRKESNQEEAVIRYLERRIQTARTNAEKKQEELDRIEEAWKVHRKSGLVAEWIIELRKARDEQERKEKEKEQKEKERSGKKPPRP